MATLKNIWNWPNNPTSGNVADTANWSGDVSYGVDQRVEELRTGTYTTWPVPAINPVSLGHTTTELSQNIAAYINYCDSHGDDTNLTFNQIATHPLVEWTPVPLTDYAKVTNVEVKLEPISKRSVIEVTTDIEPTFPVSINDGDTIKFRGFQDNGGLLWSEMNIGESYTATTGAKRIDATHYQLWADGLAGPFEIDGVNRNQDDFYLVKYTDGANETLLAFDVISETYVTGDTVTLAQTPTGFTLTGGEGTQYWLEKLADNRYSLFTDAGRTTGAVLTGETIFDSITYERLTDATWSPNVQITNGTLASYLIGMRIDSGIKGWCRVSGVATGGAVVTFPGKAIPTSSTTDQYFGYTLSPTGLLTVQEDVNGPNLQYTQTLNGGSYVVTIEFIDFANHRVDGGNFYNPYSIANTVDTWVSGGADWRDQLSTDPRYLKIWLPGKRTYTYLDSLGATVPGADIDLTNAYVKTGGTPPFSTSQTYVTSPVVTVNVDASGYLTGFTLVNAGEFTPSNDATPPRLYEIDPKPNQYVPPVPYAPDVWDTDDEWDSDGFNTNKVWPDTVRPNGAKITNSMPSSITRSQNGTKYVRSSGVLRTQLEVSYPPMTYDQFREFEATAQAARGQATPFYLKLRYPVNENILYQRLDSDVSSETVRLRNIANVGDKVLLFEGFQANQPNVFLKGEAVIFSDGNNNGSIIQVVNDNVNANIYGEAKIRIPLGVKITQNTATQLYKNPAWAIVTLAEDDLQYNVGTDGLYRLTVVFDFDEWK